MDVHDALPDLYRRLIEGWNAADADRMTAPLHSDAIIIGFDGSQMIGRTAAAEELGRIFADHQTATYVTKVRSTRSIGDGAGLLHAVAGMVPPGESEVMPERNTVQSVVAERGPDGWCVVLFQSTPARFDGRPELTEALSDELNALIER